MRCKLNSKSFSTAHSRSGLLPISWHSFMEAAVRLNADPAAQDQFFSLPTACANEVPRMYPPDKKVSDKGCQDGVKCNKMQF